MGFEFRSANNLLSKSTAKDMHHSMRYDTIRGANIFMGGRKLGRDSPQGIYKDGGRVTSVIINRHRARPILVQGARNSGPVQDDFGARSLRLQRPTF